jgi:hypothetical protein
MTKEFTRRQERFRRSDGSKLFDNGKGKLRALEPSGDLDRVFSFHLQRKARKDGRIMFMGKKGFIGCPEGTSITIYLLPKVKFMIYKENKK